jgi:hypothetical protein
MAFILLLISPLLLFMSKNIITTFSNIISVLLGTKTWIGYTASQYTSRYQLPKLKNAVLDNNLYNLDNESIDLYNLQYAREYSIAEDFKILRNKINKI